MSSPTLATATPPQQPTPTAVQTPPVSKGRKGAAAGGGKAWTAEEEVYLLQMRLERVAYKKIASKLDKTELACRLHYHQLSHGGNRRKRSTSSTAPTTPPSSSSGSVDSPVVSGILAPGFSPVNATSLAKTKGKPLLPKPANNGSPNSSPINESALTTPKRAKVSKLRVDCNTAINREKLRRLVKSHEQKFWESIAEQYGDIEPEVLRTYWTKGQGTETPPTPAISPSSQEMRTPASEVASPVMMVESPAQTPAASPVNSPMVTAMNSPAQSMIVEETEKADEQMADAAPEVASA
ncbi:hypothetical protein BZA77DRAFT_115738 [Pyronema omphalodes]|nr:hypothetical protein BZA77DRAFT_115738 [Pyronema omphalodes]